MRLYMPSMMTSEEKEFDFWNDHSLEFLEMAMRRDYQEKVQSCDGYGKSVRGDCGDTIEFFITQKKGRLEAISYDLNGCIFSHACANTVIELAQNRTVSEARKINAADLLLFLKTLPQEEAHCAGHALAAFKSALAMLDKKQ